MPCGKLGCSNDPPTPSLATLIKFSQSPGRLFVNHKRALHRFLDRSCNDIGSWSSLGCRCNRDNAQHGPVDTHSCAFGYYERDVVCLFVRAELPDPARDGCE